MGVGFAGSQTLVSLQVIENELPWEPRLIVEGLTVQSACTPFSSTSPSQSSSMPQTSAAGVPGTQVWGTPSMQLSTVRRQAPKPHVVWPGGWMHPVAGSQRSAVQTFPSLQEMLVCTQLVPLQVSAV